MIPEANTSEMTTIGAAMRWEDTVCEFELTPELFSPANREIAEIVIKRPGNGLGLVTQALEDRGEVSPDAYERINECYLAAPESLQRVRPHVEILRDRMARRFACDVANGILDAAKDVEKGDVVQSMGEPVTRAIDAALGLEESTDTGAIVDGAMKEFCERLSGRKKPMGIPTGLDEWDRRFKGLHRSHLVVISGYPSGGKTVMAGQVAWAAASRGYRTLFCSLEITGAQLVDRLVGLTAGVEGDAMIDPKHYKEQNALGEEFEKNICTGFLKVKKSPLQIEDLTGADIDKVIAVSRRAHRKEPIRVIVVDFIQRVRPSAAMTTRTREQQLSSDINRLADLTKELGVTLVVPSQLNKEGAAKHAEAINEAADLHLRIEPEQAGVRVIKDRHYGHTGALMELALDTATVNFTEGAFARDEQTKSRF